MEKGGELISCKAPMGEVGDLRVFLNDFLYFTHPAFGCSIGKVRHFFCKVHTFMWSVMWCVHVIHMSIYCPLLLLEGIN